MYSSKSSIVCKIILSLKIFNKGRCHRSSTTKQVCLPIGDCAGLEYIVPSINNEAQNKMTSRYCLGTRLKHS